MDKHSQLIKAQKKQHVVVLHQRKYQDEQTQMQMKRAWVRDTVESYSHNEHFAELVGKEKSFLWK